MAEKNYIKWWAKEINGKYGSFINLTLLLSDLEALPRTEKGYIKITVAPRKEVWQYWDTHYVFENTYVWQQQPEQEVEEEDAPF